MATTARVKDMDPGIDPKTVDTVKPPTTTKPDPSQTWTASDGTVFTDQGAFATYSSALLASGTAKTAAANATATDAANNTISNQNAFALLKSTLSGYGLDTDGSISNGILKLQQSNYDAATIQAIIQDPGSIKNSDPAISGLATAWQTRFSGNYGPNGRIANGLTPLSAADYIATENSYNDIFHAAGVPAGFYSSQEQLGNLIGGDIAPTELQDRVNTAAKSIANQDPFYTQTLQNYYGLTPSDMIAHALDPETALPLLQRQTAAATFGAAGNRQNISTDQATAEQYAALGVTQSQAEQGFGQIGTELNTDQKLAAIYKDPNNVQSQLVAATFGGQGGAQAQVDLTNLKAQEVNQFSGSSGVDKNSLRGSEATAF